MRRPGDSSSGSPPRVWGILPPRGFQLRSERFTPTRVGNTRPMLHSCLWCAVHPHACGEYLRSECSSLCKAGSPPRVWGIQHGQAYGVAAQRFTPTRVGNTPTTHALPCAPSVHPHACGEYYRDNGGQLECRGSPPRVWGIREVLTMIALTTRFTPTRVGNTRW